MIRFTRVLRILHRIYFPHKDPTQHIILKDIEKMSFFKLSFRQNEKMSIKTSFRFVEKDDIKKT